MGLALAAGLVFRSERHRLPRLPPGNRRHRPPDRLPRQPGRSPRRSAAESRTALNNYKVSALAQESRGLLKVVGERRFWTGLLARLERTLPSDVRVTRLAPRFEDTGETTLNIGLLGKDADSVVRTIAAFAKDPAFESMDLHTESTPEKGVPEGHSFEITVQYRPGAKS